MTCRTREVTLFPYTTLFRSVRLYARRVVGTGAVAAPVHRAVVGQAAQALRRHRALHRVEDGLHEPPGDQVLRSEEHTSELQSRRELVCRLLLEKKKPLRGTK